MIYVKIRINDIDVKFNKEMKINILMNRFG
jgi:hypothetical protein